jgi:hypothetical protein
MITIKNILNVTAKWLALLLCIWGVPGSNLGSKMGYSKEAFRGFPQLLQANAGVVP